MNVLRPGEGIDASRVAAGDVSASSPRRAKELRFVDFRDPHRAVERGRRVRAGRDPAGGLLLDPLRDRARIARTRGPAGRADARPVDAGLLPIVGLVMVVAPIGAFGAMAYTIGNFGVASLLTLGRLMACVYATMALFIFVVLNLIARLAGLQPLPAAGVHQGRDPDRPRHVVERGGAAPDAGQDGAFRLRPAGGGAGDSRRLLVQSRRHLDLPVDGDASSSRRRTASTSRSGSSSVCSGC